MKIIGSAIKYISIIFIGVSSLIMLPELIKLAIIIPPIYYIANKVSYSNKNSKVFGIDKNNNIASKLGKNVFSGALAKNKKDFLKVEVTNAMIDMNPEVEYNIVSNANVKRVLNKLEKEGYIEELKVNEINNKLIINNFINNLALGDINNLLHIKTNYKMSFVRSNKIITNNIIDSLEINNYDIKNKKNVDQISINYSNKEFNDNHLEILRLQELRNNLISKLELLNNSDDLTNDNVNSNLKVLSNSNVA